MGVGNVAILGCGPAGLMAAHAAEQLGAGDVIIYSVPSKSEIHGAQYLHEYIPGLTEAKPDGEVTFIKHGTRDGYAEKVYGRKDAPCSWDHFNGGNYPAWQMDKVYDKLWEKWYDVIIHQIIGPEDIPLLLDENDIVISSIPKPQLCIRGCEFLHKSVWIAPYNSLPHDAADNVVLYNGDPLDHWYRASRLFGHDSTESVNPMEGAKPGIKPLSNKCVCWSGEIAKVGRFGRWEKGVLVHDAYKDTMEALSAMQQV